MLASSVTAFLSSTEMKLRRELSSSANAIKCTCETEGLQPLRSLTDSPQERPHNLPAQRNRLHGRLQSRAFRHHQKGRPNGLRGQLLKGPSHLNHPRRLLRRWQLRHVRPQIPTSLHVHLAERALQRHGTRSIGGSHADDRGEQRQIQG